MAPRRPGMEKKRGGRKRKKEKDEKAEKKKKKKDKKKTRKELEANTKSTVIVAEKPHNCTIR